VAVWPAGTITVVPSAATSKPIPASASTMPIWFTSPRSSPT
jgi:hypothetical protein